MKKVVFLSFCMAIASFIQAQDAQEVKVKLSPEEVFFYEYNTSFDVIESVEEESVSIIQVDLAITADLTFKTEKNGSYIFHEAFKSVRLNVVEGDENLKVMIPAKDSKKILNSLVSIELNEKGNISEMNGFTALKTDILKSLDVKSRDLFATYFTEGLIKEMNNGLMPCASGTVVNDEYSTDKAKAQTVEYGFNRVENSETHLQKISKGILTLCSIGEVSYNKESGSESNEAAITASGKVKKNIHINLQCGLIGSSNFSLNCRGSINATKNGKDYSNEVTIETTETRILSSKASQ